MNMFQQSIARNRNEYINLLTEDKKEIITFFDTFIQKCAPSLNPYFANNMLGYGKFKYRNYKKEIIDWPTVALASQKNYISLYVCATKDGKYVAETYKDNLGKVSLGKSCIRIKKIQDVNLKTLRKVLEEAVQNPGLVLK